MENLRIILPKPLEFSESKYPGLGSHFCRMKLKSSPDPRKTPSISHQPRKSKNQGKNGKMGQKVNGISVSETPKIGERPYPSPFHPVEIPSKFTKISPKCAKST